MATLVGKRFRGFNKWMGCTKGTDDCLYSFPFNETRILKIDPTHSDDDDNFTTLIDIDIELRKNSGMFSGSITGPDGYIYGIPYFSKEMLLKFDTTQKVTMSGTEKKLTGQKYLSAILNLNDQMIYMFPSCTGRIVRYDPMNQSSSTVGDQFIRDDFRGAALAGDGLIYLMPYNCEKVMCFNPHDVSMTYIGNDFGYGGLKWNGAVVGPDGNVYGIPSYHNHILKIEVATQSTSLVGIDLGQGSNKYEGAVVGYDKCIYLIPDGAEFVLKFNPITGVTSTIGESLGDMCDKFSGGALAPNGYIYASPSDAKKVLKIKSWDNWLYLKHRLLVEQTRAERRVIQLDDDLNIVQHYIIHTNDDIFRTILEML